MLNEIMTRPAVPKGLTIMTGTPEGASTPSSFTIHFNVLLGWLKPVGATATDQKGHVTTLPFYRCCAEDRYSQFMTVSKTGNYTAYHRYCAEDRYSQFMTVSKTGK